MHFEFLTEDQSGKAMLELLLPNLLPTTEGHTFKVHAYKGIGRIPKGMKPSADSSKRILLDQLPRLLAGYGKAFARYGDNYAAAVIVVCDLDNRNRAAFEAELRSLANALDPCPVHGFCLAIEEGEAWYLGDMNAIQAAYPAAKKQVLSRYSNDSICGTWELLADAIYQGGASALSAAGWRRVGLEKSVWAERITPHMDVDRNNSPSFRVFVETVRRFAASGPREMNDPTA
jgi:hypothetical protein